MTEICYDTEFIEDGRTIDLISIGMVAEDGRELYRVTSHAPTIDRAIRHPWLWENVVPSLPVIVEGDRWWWDIPAAEGPRGVVRDREMIARDVREFILAAPDPQLWAWYGAYDHVALCQLWGSMIHLPEGVPMWTNDLKQEAERLGNPALPLLPGATEHNALSDAREVRYRREWLKAHRDDRLPA